MSRKKRPGKDSFALVPFDNNASVENRDWIGRLGKEVKWHCSTADGLATEGKENATCEVTLNPMACLSLSKTP